MYNLLNIENNNFIIKLNVMSLFLKICNKKNIRHIDQFKIITIN